MASSVSSEEGEAKTVAPVSAKSNTPLVTFTLTTSGCGVVITKGVLLLFFVEVKNKCW